MITALDLISALNKFTKGEDDNIVNLHTQLVTNGNHSLTTPQEHAVHHIADDYATKALIYLRDKQGDRDGNAGSAGMLMIQSAAHAIEVVQQLGVPRGHIDDHGLYFVSRAALAVFTWAHIELGHIATMRRLVRIPKSGTGRPRHLHAVSRTNEDFRVPGYVLNQFTDDAEIPADPFEPDADDANDGSDAAEWPPDDPAADIDPLDAWQYVPGVAESVGCPSRAIAVTPSE